MLRSWSNLVKKAAGSVVSGLEKFNEFSDEVKGGAEDIVKGFGRFVGDAALSQFSPEY